MRTRLAVPPEVTEGGVMRKGGDFPALAKRGVFDRHKDLNFQRDTVIVSSVNGAGIINGVSAGRAVCLVHCFEVDEDSPLRRPLANSLVDFGAGLLLANGCKEMVFLVDKANEKMQAFMEERGAVKETGDFDVYCLKVE